ncbi:hypothetical protein M514_27559 [Trichuris suis]|uniref:Uncharacterized protein n=1 Tax=Trichuris suis TaxID=68888 RepID=A0A085MSR1_9BILA|nr:hypothetical protein M514_27559 [Trichuris suis]
MQKGKENLEYDSLTASHWTTILAVGQQVKQKLDIREKTVRSKQRTGANLSPSPNWTRPEKPATKRNESGQRGRNGSQKFYTPSRTEREQSSKTTASFNNACAKRPPETRKMTKFEKYHKQICRF